MGDLDWHRFANGDFTQAVRICRIAPDHARAIGSADNRLFIHPSLAPKIVHGHRLTEWHLAMLPIIVEFGSVFLDKRDGQSLIYAYEDTVMTNKMMLAVVRPASERHEIWLRSLYAVRNKDYLRKLKRVEILRMQD